MKKYIAIIALAVVLAGGYLVFSSESKARDSQKEKPRQTARAERGDLSITVTASGRVEPEREVEIKSKASGEVIKVFADVSDVVEQGKLLFKLDPTDEERSVAKLKATLSMSKAKLEQTRLGVQAAEKKLAADTSRANADLKSAEAARNEYDARLRRAEQLFEQKVISREELDTATTQGIQYQSALLNAHAKMDDLKVQALELDKTRQEIPIAEAQVENDTVALDDAQQRLKETEVFSPINGVVSSRTVQEGVIVASGVSNVGGGTTAMTLIDLSHIYAIAAVDEADISGIKPGVKAVITADAYKDIEFSGTVVRVAATGAVESNVVTFDVKVEVDSRRKQLLKPEMTTNVTFLVQDQKNVVIVPATAIVRKAVQVEAQPEHDGAVAKPPAEGKEQNAPRMDYTRRQSYVTVVKAGGVEEERKITTGITDGFRTEIVSGLNEGEEVVLFEASQSRWSGQQRRPGPPPM